MKIPRALANRFPYAEAVVRTLELSDRPLAAKEITEKAGLSGQTICMGACLRALERWGIVELAGRWEKNKRVWTWRMKR